jgi:nucleoside-diphosphate-sugar epimerase
MRILITGGASALAQALAAALSHEHSIRLVDAGQPAADVSRSSAPPGSEFLRGDLRDPQFAEQIVAGTEAILHLAPLWPGLAPETADAEMLDHASRGTYVLLTAAVGAGVRRGVLASTLDLFAEYPSAWRVGEGWKPRPSTEVSQLAPYLAEAAARELSRVEPLHVICLRLGHVVSDAEVAGRTYDPRWLHVEDAVQAFQRALAFGFVSPRFATTGPALHGWWVFHIPGGGGWTQVPLAWAGDERFGYAPTHTFADAPGADAVPVTRPAAVSSHEEIVAPRVAIPSRPIRRVVVFGAGGPLASAAAPILAGAYTLRLTDRRPLRDIAADPRRAASGQPLPALLGEPHEMREVDVRDLEQVLAACEGMDAIVNCAVVRPHPVEAFRVNCLGAYNVMRAAVAHRIRRVVQTGPQQVTMDRPGGYWWDFDLPDDVPPRPGSLLYTQSKYLGQEVCRIFAEEYDLEVPVLLFSRFLNPEQAEPTPDGVFPMTVSWEDAGHALRCALAVPALPSPFEVFHILADLPHGKYTNAKAKRVLGWQPRDTLEHLWVRRPPL